MALAETESTVAPPSTGSGRRLGRHGGVGDIV